MTGEEMKAALAELGWKQADLCRRISKDKNTVSKWATLGPPAWISEYLRAMLAIDRIHRQFIRPPRATPPANTASKEAPVTGRAKAMVDRLRTDKQFQLIE
jgi:transcriptional regulator with XRE-family HTH domain